MCTHHMFARCDVPVVFVEGVVVICRKLLKHSDKRVKGSRLSRRFSAPKVAGPAPPGRQSAGVPPFYLNRRSTSTPSFVFSLSLSRRLTNFGGVNHRNNRNLSCLLFIRLEHETQSDFPNPRPPCRQSARRIPPSKAPPRLAGRPKVQLQAREPLEVSMPAAIVTPMKS